LPDCTPYGTLLDGRHGQQNGTDYRYGFQGQEADDEIKGEGNSYSYKYRMHDPRIGRFFAIDPLAPKYPELTPYQFSSNSPIYMNEIEGLEGQVNIYNNNGSGAEYSGRSYTDPNLNQDVNRTDNWDNGHLSSAEYKTTGGDHIITYSKREHYSASQVNGIVFKNELTARLSGGSTPDYNQVGGAGTSGGVNVSVSGTIVYEQINSTTIIQRKMNDFDYDKEYEFLYPSNQGDYGVLGSDGHYWKGCLSCHSSIGAYSYAANNSREAAYGRFTGEVIALIGTEALGSLAAGVSALRTSSRAATRTYEIGEGVRRSHIMNELGYKSVSATDNTGAVFEAPIEGLYSPMKSSIPNDTRYQQLLNSIKEKGQTSPIYVQPGSRGVPIGQVKLN
jgi:RHS repeat-associated protein